jgi:hypothetical protein
VASASLADEDDERQDFGGMPFRPVVTGALAVTNSYFERGYRMQDGGLIVQPLVTLAGTFRPAEGWRVQPYASGWTSGRLDGGEVGPDSMSELMAGVVVQKGGWTADLKYTYHTHSPFPAWDGVHELGGRLTYELATTTEGGTTYGVRPSLALGFQVGGSRANDLGWGTNHHGELVPILLNTGGKLGEDYVYAEVGAEPFVRFTAAGQRMSLSLPIQVGLSPDHYYADADGHNAAVGFVSAGVAFSSSLPVPEQLGKWFFTGSVRWLHLTADSTRAANGGDREAVVGQVGVGFSF